MSADVFQVLAAGPGKSIQDAGRPGWKRFGLPVGGAMDAHSARWANLLTGNPAEAPVLEILLGGLRLRTLRPVTVALTGAEAAGSHPLWRSVCLAPDEELTVGGVREGVWNYLAVEGGFDAPLFFGSASVNQRAGLGTALQPGDLLRQRPGAGATAIAGRFLPEAARPRRDGSEPLPVWPGPDWELFTPAERARFLDATWTISSRSDRAGYRLEGPDLGGRGEILSAPVTVGTIQAPPHGQPIVLMRDGPTVGGYPRLAIVDPEAVSTLAQCAPGRLVRFQLITTNGHQL